MRQKPILYGTETSPTVRAVLLTLKALNIDYEFRIVNTMRKENLTSDYLTKNPAHTIPTLEDEPGKYISDSHAIMTYLVDKYAKSDTLYPRDLYKRAKVNEILHFENGAMFISCVKQVLGPIFNGQRNDIPDEKVKEIELVYDILESYFGEHKFLAGEQMTLADFSCLTTVTSILFIKFFSEEKHPKLCAWLERMSSLPYYEEVMRTEGVMRTLNFLTKKISKL